MRVMKTKSRDTAEEALEEMLSQTEIQLGELVSQWFPDQGFS